ncbi:MAG: hypothetical protein FJ296_05465 [Planctomycetes bacterium]|nr:hypothetical protein [Planctomycetota bacterium]
MQGGSKGAGAGLLLAALAGAAGGFVAGMLAAGDAPEPAVSTTESSLARPMADLARETAALRDELSRRPVVATQGAVATSPAPLVAQPDVQQVLQQLAAAIADIARRADAGAALAVPVPDSQRHARVRQWFPTEDGNFDEDEHAWRAHALWTCQQLLDAYGPPDSVWMQADGSECWQYAIPDEGNLDFTVHDGRVVRTDAY